MVTTETDVALSVVRGWYNAYDRRDVDALCALAHPGIEIARATPLLRRLPGASFHGHTGIRTLIAWADQTYEGVRVVSTEARVIRPFVLVRATYRSEVRDEPERIAHSYSLFGVVGGLIVRIRAFARESDAARAATAGVLTPRQCEILQLLSGGLNAPDVAERLVLSPTTVRTHVRDAMVRLGARNRVEAVALALRTGEIEM